MKQKAACCLGLVLLGVSVFAASRAARAEQARKPATATTAAAAPDLSTVRSAALAWVDASWNGDAGVADQILVDDDAQREFMAGPLRFSAALRALEAAAIEQWGDAGRQVGGYPDGSAKAMEPKLETTEEDDRASASFGKSMMALPLRRIDGRWRVDLADIARDRRARRASEASTAAAKAADDVAAEIREGKFKSAEDAKAAFAERRLARAGQ
jgi:hypothetical protein